MAGALDWTLARTPAEVVSEREEILQRIERAAAHFRASGAAAAWLAGSDPLVARVSASVNGPLCAWLAGEAGWDDAEAVDTLRHGAPLIGVLPRVGLGAPINEGAVADLEVLRREARKNNVALLRTLREDPHSEELLRVTRADHELGRMSEPFPACRLDPDSCVISPRFAVVQGKNPDGSPRIRPIDDLSRSQVNEHTRAQEKASHDTTDHLVSVGRQFMLRAGVQPSFWKTDVDAAYRRVPLRPDHRFAAYIAFVVNGAIVAAQHWATPFGGAGAVYSWERLGRLLAHCVRSLLFIVACRYVDDFFGPDYPECVAHTTACIARLVRAMLGPSSIADRKCEHGLPLVILGLSVNCDARGLTLFPARDKVEKWTRQIQTALQVRTARRSQRRARRGCFARRVACLLGQPGSSRAPCRGRPRTPGIASDEPSCARCSRSRTPRPAGCAPTRERPCIGGWKSFPSAFAECTSGRTPRRTRRVVRQAAPRVAPVREMQGCAYLLRRRRGPRANRCCYVLGRAVAFYGLGPGSRHARGARFPCARRGSPAHCVLVGVQRPQRRANHGPRDAQHRFGAQHVGRPPAPAEGGHLLR